MIPVHLATRIVVPDSRNGDVKSTAASLSAFTLIFQIFCGLLKEYLNIILDYIT